VSFFYEIRGANNTVLLEDGGVPTRYATKIAGREDTKGGWPGL